MSGQDLFPALLIAWVASTGVAQAQESLSCQVGKDMARPQASRPKVIDFTWSTAHATAEPTGAFKTSIGRLAPGDRLHIISLNGKALNLPQALRGDIRFGSAYDYGNRLVLAYLVERDGDSSAQPSEVVYRLDRSGAVSGIDILPGGELNAPGHCNLIQ